MKGLRDGDIGALDSGAWFMCHSREGHHFLYLLWRRRGGEGGVV